MKMIVLMVDFLKYIDHLLLRNDKEETHKSAFVKEKFWAK